MLPDGRRLRVHLPAAAARVGAEPVLLIAILALAALLRLPGLDARGGWDVDQGRIMLVLQGLVSRGEVPLLGQPASIGQIHHGAVFFYLLAPAAFLSGADPVAVATEMALAGVAMVAATWWLGRLVGGPLAGLLAGLLAAVSPAGIEGSIAIWNPGLVPLASAIALAAAIQARRTGSARWWVLAGTGSMVAMQCHVAAVLLLPPLAVAWLLDLRSRSTTAEARRTLLGGAGAVLVIAAGFLPLGVYELGHGFAETRAIVAYVAAGGSGASVALPGRLYVALLRSVSWPVAGLLTDHPGASGAAIYIVLALAGVAVVRGPRDSRRAAAGLAGLLAWSVVALAFVAPGLAVITPGLPNDHYHAFLDPVVLVLAGAGLARLAGVGKVGDRGGAVAGREPRTSATVGRRPAPVAAAGVLLAALVAIGIAAWPPAVSPDGGWRLADAAAAQIIDATRTSDGIELVGIPAFKPADALAFPLVRRGLVPRQVGDASPPGTVVVVCDPMFDSATGAACGGAAEDRWAAGVTPRPRLLERFVAGSRRIVTIYGGPETP